MINLKGKVALITGSISSGGIGRGIAESLASAGTNIVLHGRSELSPKIEEQLAALKKDHGVEAIYLRADMTKPDEVQRMVHTAAKTFGRLDILVNNAGMQHVHPVEAFPVDEFKEIIDCHLTGAFVAAQAAIPYMKKQGWGRIINIVSAQAWDPQPGKIGYVSAKFGLRGLTEGLAVELAGTGITCNSISPGFVDTPLVQKQLTERAEREGISVEEAKTHLLRVHSTGRFVPVEQVADIALSLCSDKHPKTGRDYKADAGWTAEAAAKHLFYEFGAVMKELLRKLSDKVLAGHAVTHMHGDTIVHMDFFPAIVGFALILPHPFGTLKPSDSPVAVRGEAPITNSAPVPVGEKIYADSARPLSVSL